MKHVERKGSRHARTGTKRCRVIGQVVGKHLLLANLTQAVSVYCESIAVENYPKSGHTMVGRGGRGAKLGRGGDRRIRREAQKRGVYLVALRWASGLRIGRCCSRLERGPVTTTGRCAEHKKCGSFHVAENRHPGWGAVT